MIVKGILEEVKHTHGRIMGHVYEFEGGNVERHIQGGNKHARATQAGNTNKPWRLRTFPPVLKQTETFFLMKARQPSPADQETRDLKVVSPARLLPYCVACSHIRPQVGRYGGRPSPPPARHRRAAATPAAPSL